MEAPDNPALCGRVMDPTLVVRAVSTSFPRPRGAVPAGGAEG